MYNHRLLAGTQDGIYTQNYLRYPHMYVSTRPRLCRSSHQLQQTLFVLVQAANKHTEQKHSNQHTMQLHLLHVHSQAD